MRKGAQESMQARRSRKSISLKVAPPAAVSADMLEARSDSLVLRLKAPDAIIGEFGSQHAAVRLSGGGL